MIYTQRERIRAVLLHLRETKVQRSKLLFCIKSFLFTFISQENEKILNILYIWFADTIINISNNANIIINKARVTWSIRVAEMCEEVEGNSKVALRRFSAL